MIDPAVIGTTIIWLEKKRSEAAIERAGLALPADKPMAERRRGRRVASWLRRMADRLEPAAGEA